MAILAILLTLSIKCTEVYICGWWFGEYDCRLIGEESQSQDKNNEIEDADQSNTEEWHSGHLLFPDEINILSH